MRRLALLALLALVHLLATVLAMRLSFGLALGALGGNPAPVLLEAPVDAASWGLTFPVMTAAYLAGVDLFDAVAFYGLAALNSAAWVAAAVLLRRAWARHRSRAGAPAGGAA